MRKVTYGCAVSLDGYIAGPNGEVDWLMWCDEAAEVASGYWANVDAILMGRKTWEFAVSGGQGGESSSKIATYVFSRTLSETPGATPVSEDAVDFVRKLKSKEGREICLMGGGDIASALIGAGVVDEIGLNVHPVILGGGTPMFTASTRSTQLSLIESRSFSNGCVYSIYRT